MWNQGAATKPRWLEHDMTADDTIYALSSGAGRAAVAVVRVSGRDAGTVLRALAGGLPPPRQLSWRKIADASANVVLDEALVAWLPGPNTVTGEDVAELHLHGSQAVLAGVFVALSRLARVRPAEPGEFTRRAFLNGKLDLVQVEGLGDLLDARTQAQREQAYRQMSGQMSSIFDGWRNQILQIRADIEAAVDFVDEPGVAEEAAGRIDLRIDALTAELTRHQAASASAEVIRQGVRIVLAGRPNTGKSSLLNALSRRDAAIVSSIPGTTRDSIEVSMDVRGFPVILTDTAGLRSVGSDPVEDEGMRRSRKHAEAADILLWVASPDILGSDSVEPGIVPDLMVINKVDLRESLDQDSPGPSGLPTVRTSAVSSGGLAELVEKLMEIVEARFGHAESAILVSERQRSVTKRSIELLNQARNLPVTSLELRAEVIRHATDEIGRLTGRIDVEEWLGEIFSRFCIGK